MQVIQGNKGGLIKAWIDGVTVEEQARAQLDNIAAMPFIHKHVAIMPDVHWGMGATVGSVIPTKGAIIPAAVGVDTDYEVVDDALGTVARETKLGKLAGSCCSSQSIEMTQSYPRKSAHSSMSCIARP